LPGKAMAERTQVDLSIATCPNHRSLVSRRQHGFGPSGLRPLDDDATYVA